MITSANQACRLLLVSALAVAFSACSASPTKAADDSNNDKALLASDLYYDGAYENYEFSLKIDPSLSEAPALVRAIKDEHMEAFDPKKCEGAYKCFIFKKVEAGAHRGLLVSALVETNEFYGGAHPSMEVKSYLYHKVDQTPLTIPELFDNWPAAQAILQKEWCAQLTKHSFCPVIGDQALLLTEGVKGVSSITVRTSDGAFGSYAEGPATGYLQFDENLLMFLKPKYRPLFAVEEPCC